MGVDVVAVLANQAVVALADMNTDYRSAFGAGERAANRVGEPRVQMDFSRRLEVDRAQQLVGAVERAEDDLAARKGVEGGVIAVAYTQSTQACADEYSAAAGVVNAKGIQFVPVEDDLVAVGLANGEGERQYLQAIGDADEFVDVELSLTVSINIGHYTPIFIQWKRADECNPAIRAIHGASG